MTINTLKAPDSNTSRLYWVDTIKGLAILLVVTWHIFNFPRLLLPLIVTPFFFTSGLFAGKSLALPWSEYLDRKVLSLVYLYCLWATLLNVCRTWLEWDTSNGWLPILVNFFLPAQTLWFLCALAIVLLFGRMLRPVPPLWLFIASSFGFIGGFTWPIWQSLPFIEFIPAKHLLRLTPFFFLGIAIFPWVKSGSINCLRTPILYAGVPVYLVAAIAYFYYYHPEGPVAISLWSSIIMLSLGTLGLFCCIALAQTLPQKAWLTVSLSYLGRNSLYIFVLHRFVMLGSHSIIKLIPGLSGSTRTIFLIDIIVVLPMAILLPLWIGRALGKTALFERPNWLRISHDTRAHS